MLSCEELFEIFKKNDLLFFTGIPDSTFKDWMKFLDDEHGKRLTNIIPCNECEAIATAAGYYLATSKVGVVYMQNSGEGKTVNPLTSLCDPEVYSIPVLLMIGWRGEPGKKDEPQHKKMGKIMLPLLEVLEIPYQILPQERENAERVISQMKKIAEEKNAPAAVIIKKDTLSEYQPKKKTEENYEMKREEAIKIIIDSLSGSEVIISTTGKTSRELFESRLARGEKPRDFYTVGSMGCSASIAHGIALQKTNKPIFIFDGDGSVIMQMGALATIGHYQPKNLYHILFDNASYESTGGQPTVAQTVKFNEIALACGYKSASVVETKEELQKIIKKLKYLEGPQMLVIKIKKGARENLGRPTTTPTENKESFMEKLKDENQKSLE